MINLVRPTSSKMVCSVSESFHLKQCRKLEAEPDEGNHGSRLKAGARNVRIAERFSPLCISKCFPKDWSKATADCRKTTRVKLALPLFIPLFMGPAHFECPAQLVLQVLSQETKPAGVYKIQHLRGEMCQCQKDRKSDERSTISIPLLGGHLVNRESWKQHLFVILLFSSLLRLTSAGCQICHLSNGFLICLGFHLADIVTSPPLSSSFTFFLSLSTAGCF